MKIAIDGRKLTGGNHVGVGVFARNIIKAILKQDRDNIYLIYVNSNLGKVDIDFDYKNVRIIDIGGFSNPILWTMITLSRRLFEDRPDVFYSPMDYIPVFSPRDTVMIPTLHDLAPILERKYITAFHSIRSLCQFLWMSLRSSIIFSACETTKSDFLKTFQWFKGEVVVCSESVNEEIFNMNTQYKTLSDMKSKYSLPEKYVLFLGTLQGRKNTQTLIRAVDQLNEESLPMNLVLGGKKGWKDEVIKEAFENMINKDRVIFTGYVDTEDLPSLYYYADLFVLPSFYEGFGLPVLEAMWAGCPVVTSNVSSLPEVVGDAAVTINPHSLEELKSAIYEVYTNKNLAEELVQKGFENVKRFSWEKSAKKIISVINTL